MTSAIEITAVAAEGLEKLIKGLASSNAEFVELKWDKDERKMKVAATNQEVNVVFLKSAELPLHDIADKDAAMRINAPPGKIKRFGYIAMETDNVLYIGYYKIE